MGSPGLGLPSLCWVTPKSEKCLGQFWFWAQMRSTMCTSRYIQQPALEMKPVMFKYFFFLVPLAPSLFIHPGYSALNSVHNAYWWPLRKKDQFTEPLSPTKERCASKNLSDLSARKERAWLICAKPIFHTIKENEQKCELNIDDLCFMWGMR